MKLSDAFKVLWERIKGIQAGTVKQETIADLYGNNAPKGKLSEIREARKERLAKKREQSQRPPRADAAPPPTPIPNARTRCRATCAYRSATSAANRRRCSTASSARRKSRARSLPA